MRVRRSEQLRVEGRTRREEERDGDRGKVQEEQMEELEEVRCGKLRSGGGGGEEERVPAGVSDP